MHPDKSTIVADGPKRHRDANDYAAIRARLLTALTQRHDAELRRASFFHRLWIAVKIRRAVRAELRKIFPPGALHLVLARR